MYVKKFPSLVFVQTLINQIKERAFVKKRNVRRMKKDDVKLRVGWRRRHGYDVRERLRKYFTSSERKKKNFRERRKRERYVTDAIVTQ